MRHTLLCSEDDCGELERFRHVARRLLARGVGVAGPASLSMDGHHSELAIFLDVLDRSEASGDYQCAVEAVELKSSLTRKLRIRLLRCLLSCTKK